jgi:hypothetical protein
MRYVFMYVMGQLTRVGLNTGGYLTCPYVIEEGDILTQNGLEIAFSQSFGTDLSRVYPYVHKDKGADKNANSWNLLREQSKSMYVNQLHTDINKLR